MERYDSGFSTPKFYSADQSIEVCSEQSHKSLTVIDRLLQDIQNKRQKERPEKLRKLHPVFHRLAELGRQKSESMRALRMKPKAQDQPKSPQVVRNDAVFQRLSADALRRELSLERTQALKREEENHPKIEPKFSTEQVRELVRRLTEDANRRLVKMETLRLQEKEREIENAIRLANSKFVNKRVPQNKQVNEDKLIQSLYGLPPEVKEKKPKNRYFYVKSRYRNTAKSFSAHWNRVKSLSAHQKSFTDYKNSAQSSFYAQGNSPKSSFSAQGDSPKSTFCAQGNSAQSSFSAQRNSAKSHSRAQRSSAKSYSSAQSSSIHRNIERSSSNRSLRSVEDIPRVIPRVKKNSYKEFNIWAEIQDSNL